jgi:hypothetical protein
MVPTGLKPGVRETSFLVKASRFPTERGGELGPVGCGKAVQICKRLVAAGKSSLQSEEQYVQLLGQMFVQTMETVVEPTNYTCPKCDACI